MEWLHPYFLLLILPALALLLWFDAKSSHPMSLRRRRALLIVRAMLVIVGIVAIASPARVIQSGKQSVIFLLDHSRSQGDEGIQRVYAAAKKLQAGLDSDTEIGFLTIGKDGTVLASPAEEPPAFDTPRVELMDQDGSQTNISAAVDLAKGLFPAGTAKHVVIIGDGQETSGSLERTAREAAVSGIKIHALPVEGVESPDVRVRRVATSQTRLNEGASLEVMADIETSIGGKGKVRLFENGLEVESREITLEVGEQKTETFQRIPERRNVYNYRVTVEGFENDTVPENNEALATVDVRGKPLLLYIEGEEGQSHFLQDAMAKESIQLDVRGPESIPRDLNGLGGYDGIILSDVAAHHLGEQTMAAIRDYVDVLGGGFIMIGGVNSFGVGGYYRTPIEEILPVKLKAPDQEEQFSSALALVIDRSGSMSGQKIELCKSAAKATAEVLTKGKDFIGVYAFDSVAHVVVPMTRVTSLPAIAAQINSLTSGGGTNIFPGMTMARDSLLRTRAKVKHMIVLTDGQTSGKGYAQLAGQCRNAGITISTVAIGNGAQVPLLQSIATAGGGQAYVTLDPAALTRIFTKDTMVHTGRMIREESFQPDQVETHPMLKNWEKFESPDLLGYVKTIGKATAQVPLVTDRGEPLLAHWRYGLGKVTAFTSDCKSRWAALWISNWSGYSQLWAQIFRETARQPQGQNMDIRIENDGLEFKCYVDLLEDAGKFRNDADVEAEVYFVPANALGSSLKKIASRKLNQVGPGLYTGSFRPEEAGVYMIRARDGSQMVSASVVHNPSSEVATGRTDTGLLEKACAITGGSLLKSADGGLRLEGESVVGFVELWPYLVLVLLFLFLADIIIRRWENVRGLIEFFQTPFSRKAES